MTNISRAAEAAYQRARTTAFVAAALAAVFVSPVEVSAQEAPGATGETPSLQLELNALQPSDKGCRFTFVAFNQLGGEVSQVAFELALFDKAGMISRLTIVDFKELPQGKTKVRQFDFPGVDCGNLGRVLVNDTTQCMGANIEPQACIRNLKTETGTDVIFGS